MHLVSLHSKSEGSLAERPFKEGGMYVSCEYESLISEGFLHGTSFIALFL